MNQFGLLFSWVANAGPKHQVGGKTYFPFAIIVLYFTIQEERSFYGVSHHMHPALLLMDHSQFLTSLTTYFYSFLFFRINTLDFAEASVLPCA